MKTLNVIAIAVSSMILAGCHHSNDSTSNDEALPFGDPVVGEPIFIDVDAIDVSSAFSLNFSEIVESNSNVTKLNDKRTSFDMFNTDGEFGYSIESDVNPGYQASYVYNDGFVLESAVVDDVECHARTLFTEDRMLVVDETYVMAILDCSDSTRIDREWSVVEHTRGGHTFAMWELHYHQDAATWHHATTLWFWIVDGNVKQVTFSTSSISTVAQF